MQSIKRSGSVSITFNPVKETNFGKKRSRRSQNYRKNRKLDMGCFVPSTVVSTCPTVTATTTMANLSAPSNPPSILDVPKLPAPSKPSKTWAKPTPQQYHFHPQYILICHEKKIGMETCRKRERGWTRLLRNNSEKWQKPEEGRGKKRMPHYVDCVYLTQLILNQIQCRFLILLN